MKIERQNLLGRVEPRLLNMDDSLEYEVCRTDPSELFMHSRLDLAFKLFFLKTNKYSSAIGERLYLEHIKAFSKCSFQEPDNPEKRGADKFIKTFSTLARDLADRGYDESLSLVPVSQEGVLLNGGHRVSAAAFCGCSVQTVTLPLASPCYNGQYFLERGMSSSDVELGVTQFLKVALHCYIALLWPTATSGRKCINEKIFFNNIIYQKDVYLSYNGGINLMTQVYAGASWLGDRDSGFNGVQNKHSACFNGKGPLKIIAFQCDSLAAVQEIKKKVREFYGIGNHSIHITDTKDEAIEIANILFSDNSIHFLNNSKPYRYGSNQDQIDYARAFIKLYDIDPELTVIDSGMVLAVYGLRVASDIDYLFLEAPDISIDDGGDIHDAQLVYHGICKEELILNPKYYFYYRGLKFISFRQVYRMKTARGQLKDKQDIALMKGVVEKRKFRRIFNSTKGRIMQFRSRINLRIKNFVKFSLQTIGLYKWVNMLRSRD